ncbi:hypothetical protein QJS10_CPA16g01272 [Acorus calamus]|uniref:Uncharacterized protein n=1 Tax=Acorus calamus TaxID=4465 RepID=A0AAV9CYY7_ACOCL|nr:hypothetical protein QJS10_CPA16g01272 [Acorus calamus]
MAVSAFKSTSKRGNFSTPATGSSSTKETNTEDPQKKSQHRRRSRSVSAASRTHFDSPSSRLPLNISEFSDKRDNPLFSSSSPSPPGGCKSEKSIGFGEFDRGSRPKPTGADVSDGRRGRVASRSSGGGSKFSGRSLSKVDTGRRRQAFLNSESEIEDGSVLCLTRRNKNVGYSNGNIQKKPDSITKSSELLNQTRSSRTWTSQHPPLEPWDSPVTTNWDDESMDSFSEMEEQTIEAFFERTEANHRKNSAVVNLANITDARTEFVDPDAIEFISDVQSEYAAKFEQSQDRARKLRADLAVEEQREQELGRILKQMLPDPRNSESQKPHIKRKMSNERRKISRHLTEEAMNYFDECVSLSTFDSSDFSASEDPPFCPAAGFPPVDGRHIFLSSTNRLHGDLIDLNKDLDNQSQYSLSHESYDASASTNSSTIKTTNQMNEIGGHAKLMNLDMLDNENIQSSRTREPLQAGELHDIRNYIKKFEKEQMKEDNSMVPDIMSRYNVDDYNSSMLAEGVLFEKVIMRNRIESGGLLVCDVRRY